MESSSSPTLIEHGVKNFFYEKLHKCHQYKMTMFSYFFNISIFVVFTSVLVIVLYLCRKEKLTPYEYSEKMRKDQEYVVSKIRDYQVMQNHSTSTSITNLPTVQA
jgi:hypothetical protein